jgi:hypothetical protein
MHQHDYHELRDAAGSAPTSGRPLYNTMQASAYLLEKRGIKRAPSTLAKLRVVGGGPAFLKIGSKDVAYDEPSLDAYALALISGPLRSTSEAA